MYRRNGLVHRHRVGRPSTTPGGFTLVELLVVIAIIAMLVGLLVPAVQMAREAGRRATCINNQKQIGTAILNFATAKDKFPSGFSLWNPDPNATPVCVGWVPPLLPYLEQNALYKQMQITPAIITNGPMGTTVVPRLSVLICPSADAPTTWAPLSYVTNAGMQDNYMPAAGTSLDWRENGVFFDNFTPTQFTNKGPRVTTELSYISGADGTSMTILLSENLEAEIWMGKNANNIAFTPASNPPATGSAGWQSIIWYVPPTAPYTNPGFLNRPVGVPSAGDAQRAKPTSAHPGGFIVTMCDGRAQFMSEDVEYRVYALTMAPDSNGAKTPGATTGVPYPMAPPWMTGGTLTPISEADITK
jgi:prepilin-type N-terminal cleavage/methylation domain-containing protein